jgi:hypothetical protein
VGQALHLHKSDQLRGYSSDIAAAASFTWYIRYDDHRHKITIFCTQVHPPHHQQAPSRRSQLLLRRREQEVVVGEEEGGRRYLLWCGLTCW